MRGWTVNNGLPWEHLRDIIFVNVCIVFLFFNFISKILCFIGGTKSRALTYPTLEFYFYFLVVRSSETSQCYISSVARSSNGYCCMVFIFKCVLEWPHTCFNVQSLRPNTELCTSCAPFHCGITKKSEHALFISSFCDLKYCWFFNIIRLHSGKTVMTTDGLSLERSCGDLLHTGRKWHLLERNRRFCF